jgi:hypothetical protein
LDDEELQSKLRTQYGDKGWINIATTYLNNTVKSLKFLPPSIDKARSKEDFFVKLKKQYSTVPILSKRQLKRQRAILKNKINLVFPDIKVVNRPVGDGFGVLSYKKGYQKDNICILSKSQQKFFNIGHKWGDNTSCGTLVKAVINGQVVYGVVAARNIDKGTLVFIYGGEILCGDHLMKLKLEDKLTKSTWVLIEHEDQTQNVLLVPIRTCNITRFINAVKTDDITKANLIAVKVQDKNGVVRVCLVTIKHVKEGEQLLYWYGDRFPTSDFLSYNDFINNAWTSI